MAVSSIDITPGSGKSIETRTDDVNSYHRQVIVIGDPTAGLGVAGVDATYGLDVDVTRQSALVAGTAAIGKLVANSGVDIGDVDVTSLPVGTAAMAAATPVTIATDDTVMSAIKTAVQLIDDAISGTEMQVDVVAALPTGTNAIGKLAANSGVDIGDVDVLTMPGSAAEGGALPGSFIVVAGDDGTDTHPIQLSATGDLKITLDSEAVVLGAGSAAIGKLAANSGVDIGDVTLNNLTSTPVYINHSITGIGHGVKTVATAGTDVVLAASTPCKKIDIQAQTDNTGLIAVGGSGVDATEATGIGVILYPGDSYELDIDNLNDVYIDSTINGEGVRFTYFT